MKLPSITKALLLAAVLLAPVLHAATPEELQFQQLKQQRTRAPAGTSEMLDQRYRMSLEQLLRLPGVAAQPELARQIQAELQATAGAKAAVAATAKPTPLRAPAGRPATKSELKKLFENSQWRAFDGSPASKGAVDGSPASKGAEQATFTFLKDGSFSSSKLWNNWARFKHWEVEAPDVLKLLAHDPRKDRKSPYRAFRVNFDQKIAVPNVNIGGEAFSDIFLEYDAPLDRKK